MTLITQKAGCIIADLGNLSALDLCKQWRLHLREPVPDHLPKGILARVLGYRLQEQQSGGLSKKAASYLKTIEPDLHLGKRPETPYPSGQRLKPGCQLIREHLGVDHIVAVVEGGFEWRGVMFASLSSVAKAITGTNWNGHRFFGLKGKKKDAS